MKTKPEMTPEQTALKCKVDEVTTELNAALDVVIDRRARLEELSRQCDHDYAGNVFHMRQIPQEDSYYTCMICGAEYTTPVVVHVENVCKSCGETHGKANRRAKWSVGTCDICRHSDLPVDTPASFGLTGVIRRGKVETIKERKL